MLDLLSNTADGMFVVDMSFRILIWNHAAEKILGYTLEEVIGRHCCDILLGRDKDGNPYCSLECSVVTKAKQRQLIENCDVQARSKKKGAIWINISYILISPPNSADTLIVHLFRPLPLIASEKPRPAQRTVPFEGRRLASSGRPAVKEGPEPPYLSPREREILELMAKCMVAKEIAQHLAISVDTARTHIQRVLRKLNTHSKLEAVVIAIQHGYLSADALYTPTQSP